MKPLRIFLCVFALLLACATASAMSPTDVGVGITHLTDNAATYAVGAAVAVGSITPEMITDAKLKFGIGIQILTVVVVEAVKDAEGKIITPAEEYNFIVRRPDRSLIKMLLPLAKSGEIDDFAEKAVKNLIVGGDTDKLEDGLVFMGVVSQLEKLIAPSSAFLKSA